MSEEKICPAVGEPCIKERCLAYIPKQEEQHAYRWPWEEPTIVYVVIGFCKLLDMEFRVFAKEDS